MRYRISIFSLLVAGALAAFALGRAGALRRMHGSRAQLEVRPIAVILGRVVAGHPARHRFVLRNAGDNQLLILSTKSNCECTIGYLARRSLDPGQSTALDVTFTPKKAGEHRKVFVLVKSNDPQHPLTILTLTADVVKNVAAATTREAHL